ncbi:BlpM [Streptococcus pneumoniae]|nr:bacteriocin-type signal sequence domain protein [Streptococcus pneumoniae GA41301]EHE05221.1 bacteriocin-type signal sequence domain protein [Streptococcus pneumoniae GA17227]EHZ05581.1 bacteriocin class II with double-glycine leader peptide family protein [Streptococcus pneumoniae GA05245]KAF8255997.1 bacteriocin [Streptococcus pneumoniae]HET0486509.1 Blp family class II bacteriocin [Streptococcus pneumoniae ATCC 700669]
MDTKIMEQFHEMDITMLSSIEGGKNNWQTNVLEGGGAAFGGWGLGTAICAASGVGAPFMGACGYIGAKFGVDLWAGVTGATGGVKYGRLLGPWGAAIGGIGGAVVCGYLAYTATS